MKNTTRIETSPEEAIARRPSTMRVARLDLSSSAAASDFTWIRATDAADARNVTPFSAKARVGEPRMSRSPAIAGPTTSAVCSTVLRAAFAAERSDSFTARGVVGAGAGRKGVRAEVERNLIAIATANGADVPPTAART